jgi:hypothetical protein
MNCIMALLHFNVFHNKALLHGFRNTETSTSHKKLYIEFVKYVEMAYHTFWFIYKITSTSDIVLRWRKNLTALLNFL